MTHTLIPLFADQLTHGLASLRDGPAGARVLMVEVMEEATYVRHHVKKIAFLFSAMRHFADELREAGWEVDYVRLDDPGNTGSFAGEIGRALTRQNADSIIVTEPGEHRVRAMVERWQADFGLPVDIRADDRFIASHAEFARWAEGRKTLRMEFFYREMRRRTGLLMEGDAPAGGKWNFDAENRKPASGDLFMPRPLQFEPDAVTEEVLSLIEARFSDHFGTLRPFWFAVTAAGAEAALDRFIADALAQFGDYQDAMLRGEKFLYHSVISLYINAGLLDPLSVCRRVEAAWLAGAVPLNAAEGFIRQIIGWREFVRGIYWREGPAYMARNFFDARRALPGFYWTAETDMACMAAAIGQTRDEAYAHHIQRLMVTGNFALLAGVDPGALHEWYLAVYADAFEWVEAPNTIGMSQFADGGLLGSKPYAASGAYINRMSDHCGACAYRVSQKTGEGACPFNALYWDFMARNADQLRGNPRLGPVYRNWDRMDPARQAQSRAWAVEILRRLDAGERV